MFINSYKPIKYNTDLSRQTAAPLDGDTLALSRRRRHKSGRAPTPAPESQKKKRAARLPPPIALYYYALGSIGTYLSCCVIVACADVGVLYLPIGWLCKALLLILIGVMMLSAFGLQILATAIVTRADFHSIYQNISTWRHLMSRLYSALFGMQQRTKQTSKRYKHLYEQ